MLYFIQPETAIIDNDRRLGRSPHTLFWAY
jgi:hypothetical protein